MTGPYDDMLERPRHVSTKHPPMAYENRAAQFAPFAALAGYEAAIVETARLTDQRIELSEDAIADLDRKLQMLTHSQAGHPPIVATYFQPDDKKDGGMYVTIAGALKSIDTHERSIVMMSGEKLLIEDIVDIECALFEDGM